MDTGLTLSGLQSLQEESLGDPEVSIAILDGPVDLSHPCFEGANLRRLDTLVKESAGSGPMSTHGTHVASLIFGQPGSGIHGIAPRCQGLIVPVFQDNQEGRLSQLDLARAIEQAVQEGARIINVSGGQRSPTPEANDILKRALRVCDDSNVLVVAAAGNDGCECLHVPAAVPSVLAVGAMGADQNPLEMSNWGEAYRLNGILAPGENVAGAIPGGGTASLTGSSFAAPIVSGVAALLLSIQRRDHGVMDPRSIAKAIIETATPCLPRGSRECSRYLAGTLNIPGAYALVKKGKETTMANSEEAQSTSEVAVNQDSNAPRVPETAIGGALMSSGGPRPSETVQARANPNSAPTTEHSSANGVAPAGTIPPPGSMMSDCNCNGVSKSSIYVIGVVNTDFGTEARRDSFRQLMPPVVLPGSPPASVPPNPYDVTQLTNYLDSRPSESTKLIWTLNLELTPIYAIEAETAYAEEVYSALRSALRGEALPTTDANYVSRVSIPGVLTSRTVRLFSGQVLPVVVAQPRGLYAWNEQALVQQVLAQAADTSPPPLDPAFFVRNYLDRIYYELRNLGQMAPDRAINFAATNAIGFVTGLVQLMTAGTKVPGGGGLYTLDTISVVKSPYCRMDSDCWDVQIRFFDPENVLRARAVLQFTIDVSDVYPVSLAPSRLFYVSG